MGSQHSRKSYFDQFNNRPNMIGDLGAVSGVLHEDS